MVGTGLVGQRRNEDHCQHKNDNISRGEMRNYSTNAL